MNDVINRERIIRNLNEIEDIFYLQRKTEWISYWVIKHNIATHWMKTHSSQNKEQEELKDATKYNPITQTVNKDAENVPNFLPYSLPF